MSDDSTERLVAEIPSELKKLTDADQRTNKEIVEAALWREFGGHRKSALERRIEEKENRISMIEREKNERERELREERDELEALQDQLNSAVDEKQSQLEDARDTLKDTPKDPENPAIQQWASDLGMTPEELITELTGGSDE